MKMVNMMNQQTQKVMFNPKNMDQTLRRSIMNQTIYQSAYGLFKEIPLCKTITHTYLSKFNPEMPDNICDVEVIYEHSLDIAEKYAEKGLQISKNNGLNPVVLNIVGTNFAGSNIESFENIKDELLFMRTNLSRVFMNTNIYPMKESMCAYDKMITVIRPKAMAHTAQFLANTNIFRVGVITVSPIKVTKLLNGNRMCSSDFVKTNIIIQTIFQLAIAKEHKVLILQPFGHEEENNPMEDIVKIYNYCILKFGHLFQKIIISIPHHYKEDVFNFYKSKILIPNLLVNEVDHKYDDLDIKEQLLKEDPVQEQKKILKLLEMLQK